MLAVLHAFHEFAMRFYFEIISGLIKRQSIPPPNKVSLPYATCFIKENFLKCADREKYEDDKNWFFHSNKWPFIPIRCTQQNIYAAEGRGGQGGDME
jgi:hypothetical protein